MRGASMAPAALDLLPLRTVKLYSELLAYAQASLLDQPTELADSGECLRAAVTNLAQAIQESGAGRPMAVRGLLSRPDLGGIRARGRSIFSFTLPLDGEEGLH